MHDTDIFTLMKRKDKVAQLQRDIEIRKKENSALRVSLDELDDLRTVERIGREEHYFKKDDEDLFIFSFD